MDIFGVVLFSIGGVIIFAGIYALGWCIYFEHSSKHKAERQQMKDSGFREHYIGRMDTCVICQNCGSYVRMSFRDKHSEVCCTHKLTGC